MRRFRRCQDRAAVNNNDLPVNGDHPAVSVDAVECKAECLTLAETGGRAQQDERRVPLGHARWR
jgi:hypothetical protein